MSSVSEMIVRVQNALENLDTDCPMEDIVGLCPEVTCNQVILAINHLSRTGRIRVTLDPDRTFRVHVCKSQRPLSSDHTPPLDF